MVGFFPLGDGILLSMESVVDGIEGLWGSFNWILSTAF